ncbi:MAG: hypothetical protein JSS56_20985 [Proteobacteria bacterium]|nr:hypothetical protein [Pseudomonadota bacterium]
MSNPVKPIGTGAVIETEHWRIFRVGGERFVVLQFPAAAPGRLQKSGPIHKMDPDRPMVYTRLGTCIALRGAPDRDPAFLPTALRLLASDDSTLQIEDESDALYSQWWVASR